MAENGEKCRSVFPKAQDVILKCLVLFTVMEEEKKPEHSHI